MTKTDSLLYQLAIGIIDNIEQKQALQEEVVKLRKENKKYKDIINDSVMNHPHPAEGMLQLMLSGNLSLHKSKDQA